jgi:Zn-dependent alcohol dehydrogenase
VSLSRFQRRLKEAKEGSDRIAKLVEEEAQLKQQLLEESATQRQRLDDINSEFEDLKQGGNLGTSPGT